MEAFRPIRAAGVTEVTGISCPDCSGVLEVSALAPHVLQFRCRIGHIYDSQELLAGKARVRGTAVFLVSQSGYVPTALLRNLEHNKVYHEQIVILHIEIQRVPRVDPLSRVLYEETLPGVIDVLGDDLDTELGVEVVVERRAVPVGAVELARVAARAVARHERLPEVVPRQR